MPESKWAELLQFTSKCKNLRKLQLGYTTIGEAGYWLAQSLSFWDKPLLRELWLNDCSIPEQMWSGLLQSLSSCKQLSHLSLSDNTIGKAGLYLAHSIRTWGDHAPLQELYLRNCLIPKQVWPKLLQCLSSCKQLSNLNLSTNTIGEAGRYLAHSIRTWGDRAPIQNLHLINCSIPIYVWPELLQCLSSCKQLCILDLSDTNIGEAGCYLAQSIRTWGDQAPLQELYLNKCSIPKHVWPELLQSLSSCKQLRNLRIDGNTVTGCWSGFLSDLHPGLTALGFFDLRQTAMNKSDIQHLIHLIQNNKLPSLKNLLLNEDSWIDVEDELEQLKKICKEKKGLDLWLHRERFIRRHKGQPVKNDSLFPQNQSV